MKFTTSTIALLVSAVAAVDVTRQPELVAKLRTATTNIDRMSLLPNDQDWFFDFTKQEATYTWTPGGVTNANAATFPAVVGHGMTMATLNLGPCSLLPAHLHPRASNFVVAIKGTTHTIMIAENGVKNITQTLTPGQMTIFPAGSIHTMMNVGCEDAQLISALNSEDAGTLNIANTLFNLPDDYIEAAVGQALDFQNLRTTVPGVGTGSIKGLDACIAKCNAQKVKRTTDSARALHPRNFRQRSEVPE